MEDRERRGRVSGNETLACFAVSGRHSASGGFVKKLVCETLLEAGLFFGPACSESGWREGGADGEGNEKGKEEEDRAAEHREQAGRSGPL